MPVKAYINAVTECLWYIDGHHEILTARSCSVPPELSRILSRLHETGGGGGGHGQAFLKFFYALQ